MHYTENFDIFRQNGDLYTFLNKQDAEIHEAIRTEDEEYLLNVNEEEYVNHMISKYEFENLEMIEQECYVENYEEMIPVEQFRREYYDVSGKTYPKNVLYFHIPLTGGVELIGYAPSTTMLSNVRMHFSNNKLVFRVVQFQDDVNLANNRYSEAIKNLKIMIGFANSDIRAYNCSLNKKVRDAFEARKQLILKRRSIMESLIVPVRMRENTSGTFAIPTPSLRKKIVIKPICSEKGYTAEPTLDSKIYEEILKALHDMGKEFERKPAVYKDKDEEQLRDHFLMLLEPNFEGSATGETFNKSGKTDILLRYDGSNVFIAECKFWHGEKAYLDSISQLLGYLTWRDSKAAIIIFNRNKGASSVLGRIEESTKKHSNFLGFEKKVDESIFKFRFHINDDPNKEVKLAVMVYHIPK